MVGTSIALWLRRLPAAALFLVGVSCASACGNPVSGAGRNAPDSAQAKNVDQGSAQSLGQPAQPPFKVEGELEGLLLVWFDEEGPHSAARRSEVPNEHRQRVRVDSLALAPEQRLGAEHVYMADVRTPGPSGQYPVWKVPRLDFDQWVDSAAAPAADGSPVVLYKTSWCGACKAAEAHLKERGVDYDARDVEKDPGAQQEMAGKVVAAGRRPGGVPVIDVGGELLMGFNRNALDQLLDKQGRARMN